MLDDKLIEAVRDGRFHIYPVSTIDEGIEVLTGVAAGERQEDGTYPEGTVHDLVEARLSEMAQKAREFGRTHGRDEQEAQKESQSGQG